MRASSGLRKSRDHSFQSLLRFNLETERLVVKVNRNCFGKQEVVDTCDIQRIGSRKDARNFESAT